MLIEHILRRKGTDVVTASADEPLTTAIARLAEHNVGALVVTDPAGAIVGILSERDIVRSLARSGAATLQATVGDLMTTDVTTCGPRASNDELMGVMTDRRIRHIPVVDDARLVGIVSIGDVVKTRIGELETETETLHEYIAGR